MTQTMTDKFPGFSPEAETRGTQEAPSIDPIIETYRGWVDTIAGYMSRAVVLLDKLYAEQDKRIDQLKEILAKHHSLRHVDFDAILGKVLAERRRPRESLSALVDGYRAGREAVIQEVREMFTSDMAGAVKAWPELKNRLLSAEGNGEREVVAALRQVHMEQEEISAALSGLLSRGEKLKISDLKTVAMKLVSKDSRESAELAALLAVCESAGRNAGLKWQRLAG